MPAAQTEPQKAFDLIVQDLLAESRAKQKLGKSQRKGKKALNPYKEKTVQKKGKDFEIVEVDRRLADPYWKETTRVLLLRQTKCMNCGECHEAPNEYMMLKKTHPVHGILEEALGTHSPNYDHIPVEIEVSKAEIPICHKCAKTGKASLPSNLYPIPWTDTILPAVLTTLGGE